MDERIMKEWIADPGLFKEAEAFVEAGKKK